MNSSVNITSLLQLYGESLSPARSSFLIGGEAADEGNQHVVDDGCVQTVPAVEVGDVAVMFQEGALAVDLIVVAAEQAPHVVAVPVGDAVKLMLLHLGEVSDDFGRYAELGGAVLTGIEEIECTRLQHMGILGHEECRIHADALETEHLLAIHAAHAGPGNDVGLGIDTQVMQQWQGLGRIYWYVGRNDFKIGQKLAERLDCAAVGRRRKSMKIYQSLHRCSLLIML